MPTTRYDHPHPWVSADTYVWDVNTLTRVKAQQSVLSTDSITVSIAGVATAAKQDTGNTALASLLTELQLKADLTETQPVSAANLDIRDLTSASDSVSAVDVGSGKTLLTASFSLSATGAAIAAITGPNKVIYVYAIKLVVSAALSVSWRSGGSTSLEGAQPIAANGGYVEAVNPPSYLLKTASGESLDLVITGTGTAAGRISYWAE